VTQLEPWVETSAAFPTVHRPLGAAGRRPEERDEHTARRTGAVMQDSKQHRQSPILSLVAEDAAVDAEQNALEELVVLLDRHISRLPASSEWRVAFVKMNLAASRSLSQQPLRLLQHQSG
jgi:hypothetical protein